MSNRRRMLVVRPRPVRLAVAAGLVPVTLLIGLSAQSAAAQSGTVYRWGAYQTVGFGAVFGQGSPTAVPGLTGVTALAAGNSANYALLANGQDWAWGNGNRGQLGNGTYKNSLSHPVQVRFPAGTVVTAIGEADDMAFAVDSAGNGWSWGWNGRGTLCLGTHHSSDLPVKVPGLSHLVAVTGGGGTVDWLTSGGQVYTCGLEPTGNVSSPTRVTGLPSGDPAVAISAGNAYSTVLTRSGEVWDWGFGGAGQLGNGSFKNSASPVEVQLPAGTHAVQVYSGGDLGNDGHQLAMLDNGEVVSWGSNRCGQLGAGRASKQSVPAKVTVLNATAAFVAAGGSTSFVIDTSGNLWAWGSNKGGQVTRPTSRCHATPVKMDTGVKLVSATASDAADYHG
jgi:alpha-tubulin suppressor-like RCC1 family protein